MSEIITTTNEQMPMSISVTNAPLLEKEKELVKDEQVTGLVDGILRDIDIEGVRIDSTFDNFYELVINGGDASSSSKEALVNLLKLKSDLSDKKIKVLSELVRIKLKDSAPRYIAVNQKNTINQVDTKKKLLEEKS